MTQVKILEALQKLTPTERLAIIEIVLHFTHEDIQHVDAQPMQLERKRQLAEAAQTLLADYEAGGDLTAFTVFENI